MTKTLEEMAERMLAEVRRALNQSPAITLPSPQQFKGEVLVMLHKKYPTP